MTAARALCPVASVELGKAEFGAIRAQHACMRYTVVMRMSLRSLVELGLYRLYPPPVPTCGDCETVELQNGE